MTGPWQNSHLPNPSPLGITSSFERLSTGTEWVPRPAILVLTDKHPLFLSDGSSVVLCCDCHLLS